MEAEGRARCTTQGKLGESNSLISASSFPCLNELEKKKEHWTSSLPRLQEKLKKKRTDEKTPIRKAIQPEDAGNAENFK